MSTNTRKAAIVACIRTPIGRYGQVALSETAEFARRHRTTKTVRVPLLCELAVTHISSQRIVLFEHHTKRRAAQAEGLDRR